MKKLVTILFSAVITVSALGQSNKSDQDTLIKANVTVKGKALNSKIGALLQSDTIFYYIDGLHNWPDNKYNKSIIITGDLYKTPAPVFIQQNDSIQIQGIPVKDSLEYEKNKYKWTLKNVCYK